MTRTLFLLFSLLLPGLASASMKDGPCQHWEAAEADAYCASFLMWLPQFGEDFDLTETEGRYSSDCAVPGGFEISGLAENEQFQLSLNGRTIADADMAFSYYGNRNPPVTFLFGVLSNELPSGFTVNGDQGGFYLLEDTENGRRLSHCKS